MIRGSIRVNLHPRLRHTWHVPTAEQLARRQGRRDRAGGSVILLLLLGSIAFAGPAGLDRIAALAMTLGLILAVLGRSRYRRGRLGALLAPAGLLCLLLGGSREVLLERAPHACRASYARAATGMARAGVLASEPYPDLRRWLIWLGRRSICADFIGV